LAGLVAIAAGCGESEPEVAKPSRDETAWLEALRSRDMVFEDYQRTVAIWRARRALPSPTSHERKELALASTVLVVAYRNGYRIEPDVASEVIGVLEQALLDEAPEVQVEAILGLATSDTDTDVERIVEAGRTSSAATVVRHAIAWMASMCAPGAREGILALEPAAKEQGFPEAIASALAQNEQIQKHCPLQSRMPAIRR
jgi:hypothetical protein